MTVIRTGLLLCLAILMPLAVAPAARAGTVLCTVIIDAADGAVLLQEGDCAQRVTPASTFKIPLALMGFDAGVLADARSPRLPFRTGDADWGGAAWRQDTDPAHWMMHSVVWFSQRITRALGMERLRRYALGFGYGNADFSGDAGRNNGLERAWISSSLTISPLEQTVFLRRLVNRQLPVSAHAHDQTLAIVERTDAGGGWAIFGKTGSAYPRNADGSFNRARMWGWFTGWARRDGRTLVFARLMQEDRRQSITAGRRAREVFLTGWPALTARFER